MRFEAGKKQASCVAHLVDMKWTPAIWAWLCTLSSGALENGDALRSRGRGMHSLVDMRAEGKVTRRIRKRATRQFESEEATRDEVQVGTGVVTHDFANGEDSVAGALQVSSQPAARRSQDQDLTSSFFVESVALSGSRFLAEGDDGVSSVDREKQAQERKKGVTTLRGEHVVKQPITILGERLVGHNAKVICHYSSPGVGVRVGGDDANAFSYPPDILQTAFIHLPGNSSRTHQRNRGESETLCFF